MSGLKPRTLLILVSAIALLISIGFLFIPNTLALRRFSLKLFVGWIVISWLLIGYVRSRANDIAATPPGSEHDRLSRKLNREISMIYLALLCTLAIGYLAGSQF